MLKKLLLFVVGAVLLLTTTACWPFTTSSNGLPTLTISNGNAVRDEFDSITVTVDYSVTYPNNAYASSAEPSVVCTMSQRRLREPRTFTGSAVRVTGNDVGPYTGKATIAVPDTGKYIKGSFTVECQLTGIKDDVKSNSLTVEVPACSSGTSNFMGAKTEEHCVKPSDSPEAYPSETPSPEVSPEASPESSPTPEQSVEPSPSESPTSTYNYDKPFHNPQYLIHATGHGTTSGGVVDDFYTLYPQEPDAQGNYTVPDGSGGTYGYSSDYHSGPYYTPREACTALSGVGQPDTATWVEYNYSDYFDCTGVY